MLDTNNKKTLKMRKNRKTTAVYSKQVSNSVSKM